jgi:hypothetical protein
MSNGSNQKEPKGYYFWTRNKQKLQKRARVCVAKDQKVN